MTFVSSSTYETTFRHHIPRLTFRTHDDTSGNFTLYCEYYIRAGGSKYQKEKTERISLKNVKTGEEFAVDPAGYGEIRKCVHVHSNRYSHKVTPSGGYPPEFYGVIVTVFDEQEEMKFQRASERNLLALASPVPPRD